MSKNIVFMVAIPKNGHLPSEYEFSIKSWKHFCKKHNAELFIMEEPVVDPNYMSVILQRYFLFEMLEANNIEYENILLVDADTIVHPDCPNMFELTDEKYTLIHDDGSYDWILRGMEHYQRLLFKGEWFPFWEYGNSGLQIVNKKHKPFFDEMRKLYFDNSELINNTKDTYGIGADQTILNFMLHRHNIERTMLHYKFNMTCMHKKEIIGDDMLHTKMGHVMHFNGLPNKEQAVPYWMDKTYKYLYD